MNNFNITYSQMWYFLQIINFQNYSRAAEELNISQSALSKSIATLEENLNLKLFHQNKKRLTPTEAGLFLFKEWSSILKQLDLSIEKCRCLEGGNANTLKIGVLDSHRSELYLIDAIDAFREKYPDYNIIIECLSQQLLLKKMLNYELDIVFTVKYHADYETWINCRIEHILLCPLIACIKPTNPLYAKKELTIPDLKQCNLIDVSSPIFPSYRRLLIQICHSHNFEPNIVYTSTNCNSLIYTLQNKMDIFICDKYHLDYSAEKLIFKPIIGTESGISMIYMDSPDNKLVRLFVDIIHQQSFNTITQEKNDCGYQ